MIDRVSILHNGKSFTNFKRLKVSKRLDTLAHDFTVEISANSSGVLKEFDINLPIEIHSGSTLITTGYIFNPKRVLSHSELSLGLSGRSKTADLIDSDCDRTTQFTDTDCTTIVKKILEDFDIALEGNHPPTSIKSFTISRGENCYQALLKISRKVSAMPFTLANGNLAFSSSPSPGGLMLQQGRNIKHVIQSPDYSDIFSMYELDATKKDPNPWADDPDTKYRGLVEGEEFSRFRKKIFTSSASSDAECMTQVEAEVARRKRNLDKILVTTPLSEIPEINTTVKADIPALSIKREFTIWGYSLDVGRNVSEITMELV